MRLGLKQQQPDRRDYRRAGRIEQALEDVDSEHAGHRQFFFASQQERTDRLAGASQQEDGRKTRQRHRIDIPEMRWAEILLKHFPAQRTQRVTPVDGNNRNGEQEEISIAQSVKKFRSTEIAKMKKAARAVNNKNQDTKYNRRN